MAASGRNEPKFWGSFGMHIDLPKQQQSEVTMEARLTDDPEIEVRTKLVGC